MADLNISGYTFSTTSVPTSPALKVESGTGTYYVNLTTDQRPEALSDQKVFTVSTTDYSFLRPFVTSNSLTGYSGVSNNSTVTTGYSGVSNNSTKTTGYAGVSSRGSTYGYSGYSSSTYTQISSSAETVGFVKLSISTSYGGYYVHMVTANKSIVGISYRYGLGATSVRTDRTGTSIARLIAYGGEAGLPFISISIYTTTAAVYLDTNYTGERMITVYKSKYVTDTRTFSTLTDKYGVLTSQVPLTTSSSYNESSTAKGNLSSITDLTRTATRYSSSTEKAYLSSITDLTNTATRYSSSTTVGNLSSTTELRTVTRL